MGLLDARFRAAVARNGTADAIVVGDRTVSYDEAAALVDERIRSLRPIVRPRDVVVLGRRGPIDEVIDHLAVLTLGGVSVPGADDAAQRAQIRPSVVLDAHGPRRLGGPPAWSVGLDVQPAVVVSTSGTTGSPVAVVHSHDSLAWGFWNLLSLADEAVGIEPRIPAGADDLVVDLERRADEGHEPLGFYSAMPPSTIAGLTLVHRSLCCGDRLVLPRGDFVPEELLAHLAAKVHNVGLAPPMARALLAAARTHDHDVGALISIGLGGGYVAGELVDGVESTFGCWASVGYGSTEAGGAVTLARAWDPLAVKRASVGRPLCTTAVQLVATEGMTAGTGDVWATSRAMMVGTLVDGELVRHRGPLRMGDLGSLDDAGNLRVLGRTDHVIVRGGRRIDPAEVEFVLASHPGISAAAVVGVPSRVPGETDVVALVVGRSDLARSEVRAHCRALGGPYLRRVHLVDQIPFTADGHVRRHLALEAALALEAQG